MTLLKKEKGNSLIMTPVKKQKEKELNTMRRNMLERKSCRASTLQHQTTKPSSKKFSLAQYFHVFAV